MGDPRLRGLYVITDGRSPNRAALTAQVRCALAGGARIVQYRDKRPKALAQRLDEARALSDLCRRADALLIVNDDVELAARSEAHGVHLGRDDGELEAARALLGPDAILGVSCYNDLQRGLEQARRGADYIAYGRFYPSRSKPDAVQAAPDLLCATRERIATPIVAIGGITPNNGGPLVGAGADMLAVIDAVFAQTDITAACRRFQGCFDHLMA